MIQLVGVLLFTAGMCMPMVGCATQDRADRPPTGVEPQGTVATEAVPRVEAQKAESPPPSLPGITFNLEAGYVELDAEVVGNHVDWLELIACTPNSREHETLVTVTAKPSDLHFALLLLGVEPGRTQTGVRTDEGWKLLRATGGGVFLDFVVPVKQDGEEEVASGATPEQRVVPVGEWVLDRLTGEPLNTRRWMFTGSRVMDDRGTPVYLADVNGTVASLVHFGDETLGRDVTLTQDTDGQNLAPRPDAMPPDGTKVRLRVSKAPPPNAARAPEPTPASESGS